MLIVDYGLHRVTYKHSVYIGHEPLTISSAVMYCMAKFKTDSYKYSAHEGRLYFKRRRDMTWFALGFPC